MYVNYYSYIYVPIIYSYGCHMYICTLCLCTKMGRFSLESNLVHLRLVPLVLLLRNINVLTFLSYF